MKTYFGVNRRIDQKPSIPWYRIGALGLLIGMLFSIVPIRVQAAPAQAAPFVIAADGEASTYAGKWTSLIYTEVFKRLGMPFLLDYYTLKRRSAMVEDGGIDGEASRIYSYASSHPNLIRVEESVVDLTFALYTASPTLHLQRLEDLPSANLLVEFRRGILICENTLKPLVAPDRLSDVTSIEQGIKKLLAGRTDLYCDIDAYVQEQLQSPAIKSGGKIHKVIDLGKSVPTYPYLHKRHADLAPRMAEVLKKMKAEGLIETYRVQVARELGLAK